MSDDLLDKVVDAIVNAAHSGQVGAGKIFMTEVHEAVRIRLGERGDAALR